MARKDTTATSVFCFNSAMNRADGMDGRRAIRVVDTSIITVAQDMTAQTMARHIERMRPGMEIAPWMAPALPPQRQSYGAKFIKSFLSEFTCRRRWRSIVCSLR